MSETNQEKSFADLQLNEKILKAVSAADYQKPSPIQAAAIPSILAGRDIFGCAQTGTGKTAAFSLPIMQMLDASGHHPAPKTFRALILTPTRELAEQIASNISAYGKFLDISHCKVYGGVSQSPQVRMLSKGVDILVATPGRLLDLFNQKHLNFSGVEYLVLDEADRMLDMGFLPDIRKICSKLPEKRQSLLFSATLSDEIETLARAIVNDPLKISVSPGKLTVDKIAQKVAFVELEDKLNLLESILKGRIEHSADARALIFCRTKHGSNKLAKKLNSLNINADAIHGNKSQSARQRALNLFKSGEIQALAATDIAARGIDVKEMSLVVNFDLPEDPETYVHRIGRTARAEADGEAISFCSSADIGLLRDIEKFIKKPVEELSNNQFRSEAARSKMEGARKRYQGSQGGGRQNQQQRGGRAEDSQEFHGVRRRDSRPSRSGSDRPQRQENPRDFKGVSRDPRAPKGRKTDSSSKPQRGRDNRRNAADSRQKGGKPSQSKGLWSALKQKFTKK